MRSRWRGHQHVFPDEPKNIDSSSSSSSDDSDATPNLQLRCLICDMYFCSIERRRKHLLSFKHLHSSNPEDQYFLEDFPEFFDVDNEKPCHVEELGTNKRQAEVQLEGDIVRKLRKPNEQPEPQQNHTAQRTTPGFHPQGFRPHISNNRPQSTVIVLDEESELNRTMNFIARVREEMRSRPQQQ